MSYAEAAEVIGCGVGTVCSRLYRAEICWRDGSWKMPAHQGWPRTGGLRRLDWGKRDER
jgi:hypothetical protein